MVSYEGSTPSYSAASADNDWYSDGRRRTGEVVLANVMNLNENHRAKGKGRPVVLVTHRYGWWDCMGLTTNATYAEGNPRVAIPNPLTIGLGGPGYLWGPKLVAVPAEDVFKRIGWADLALVEAVIDLAGLGRDEAAALRKAQALAYYGIVQ